MVWIIVIMLLSLGVIRWLRHTEDTARSQMTGTPIEDLEDPPWKQRFEKPWS
ncbi:MAG: hypothetical protein OSA88_03110 [Acidimicrobiales bacterium]|jgi:hypothetical protein|nr:hypothetical protein [Acidimicrobiales bacterium]